MKQHKIASVVLTRHARQRAREMGVTDADVERIVLEPEVRYPQPSRPGCSWMAQRGKLAAGYLDLGDDVLLVQTVLPRTQEKYAR